MARIDRFEGIEGWKRARALRKAVYALSRRMEFANDFALKDQIWRAAQSVASNIAEDFERGGNREPIQFLSDAKASGGEARDPVYTALQSCSTQEPFDQIYQFTLETSCAFPVS